MKDLVERLRSNAKTCKKRDPFEACIRADLENAADRIEELEAEKKEIETHWYNEGKRVGKKALEADNERLRDLCRELQQWFEAYPVDIFTPLKGDPFKKTGDYDTKEKRNLITRASASMARHMIERIPEKISKALAAVEVIDDE
jgi:restriction endonuclease S subunit